MNQKLNKDAYLRKGGEAARSGGRRTDNPYSLKSEKGHLWDEGFIKVLRDRWKTPTVNDQLARLANLGDHSNDDLSLPFTY